MKSLLDYIELRKTLRNFILEDLGRGDITSENLEHKDRIVSAFIIYKSNITCILSGIEEVEMLFDMFGCETTYLKKDGDKISPYTRVIKIRGKAKEILKVERTALNLLMRMSGIATNTRSFVEIVKHIDSSIVVSATRKTAPGLRILDKKAVVAGGGDSHRFRLDDMVIIKSNHLQIDKSITNLISLMKKRVGSSIKIECEVRDHEEALEAIQAGVDVIMLDNFSPSQVKRTINKIRDLNLRKKVKIEISGGITKENISKYAIHKPDIISVGYLTHSSEALDFSLRISN
ncbi:MAG: carboxylating nicotinate-nucleotide diphosphorylase [Nitrososphaeraceae archaeon]